MLWAGCLVCLMLLWPVECVKNYSSALGKSILFYNAQRSGQLPGNNPISWRSHSALDDCVLGGWYDGSDHLKFGLPMAAATHLLLWSVYKYKDAYINAGQLNQMYDMVKWPLDYFTRAWNSSKQEFIYQVADEDIDRAYWGRPEDMTMYRPCKAANASHPGSDVAGATAAALAAGYLVFHDKGDVAYSNQLLSKAKTLYKFATDYRGAYQTTSYPSVSYLDELCVAAVWLYRATGTAQYLTDANSFASNDFDWALTSDNQELSCQQLLYEETKSFSHRQAITNYFKAWFPGGSMQYTPCGLVWAMKWGPLGLAANSAFLALLAADVGIEVDSYRKWAVEQINYILGDNHHNGGCYSFEVGYGDRYPLQPHHRGASCPNKPAPCGQNEAGSAESNPQVLTGAIVGGPDEYDQYVDSRPDWIYNRVEIDYNSGFQGALAAIIHLQSLHLFPTTNNKCPCLNE
ncbi:endoglucanase A [Biomphalaria pfeifferi]|uniref:cellulase n=1 Tax=Biomphalaria pfeifferi TaxID=112525 RepID=A0AAD8FE75_BIOPF|nr:endoglucanase A [Biomphalaria pfeifferi]